MVNQVHGFLLRKRFQIVYKITRRYNTTKRISERAEENTSGTVSYPKHLNHHTNSSTDSYCPNHDLVREILSRLPVKSIFRFKSVSQDWLATTQDKQFIALHGSNFKQRPCICVTIQGEKKVRLFTACLSEDTETIAFVENLEFKKKKRHWIVELYGFEDANFNFNSVNGLTCIYDYQGKICIYNLSTREMMTPWIVPPFKKSGYFYGKGDEKETMVNVRPHYRFGFDEINKEYKVICIGDVTEVEMDDEEGDDHYSEEYTVCYVLTIASGGGQFSWKQKNWRDDMRTCMEEKDGLYHNGFIYWIGSKYWMDAPNSIVAFNVGSEEFVALPIPEDFFVEDEMNDYDLIEVNGCITIIKRIRMDAIRLWQLVADDGNLDSTSSHWIEETIMLTSSPFSERLVNERYDFLSIAGSNLIILVPKDIEPERDEVFLYCYHWHMKTFQEFDITGILPMLTPDTTYRISGYMESLSAHV